MPRSRGHESSCIFNFDQVSGFNSRLRSRNRSIEKKEGIIEGFAIDDNVDLHLGEGRISDINPSVSRSFVRPSDELIRGCLLFYPSSPQLAITAPNCD